MSLNIPLFNIRSNLKFASSNAVIPYTTQSISHDKQEPTSFEVRKLAMHGRKRRKKGRGIKNKYRARDDYYKNNKNANSLEHKPKPTIKEWEIAKEHKEDPLIQINLLEKFGKEGQRIHNNRYDNDVLKSYQKFIKSSKNNNFSYTYRTRSIKDDKGNTIDREIVIDKFNIFQMSDKQLKVNNKFKNVITQTPLLVYSFMKGYHNVDLLDKFVKKLKKVDQVTHKQLYKCLKKSQNWGSIFRQYFVKQS